MSRSQFSLQRALGTAGFGLVLSAAAMLPAAAQQAAQHTTPDAATSGADSLTVTRDPVTGQLRAATAAEQASLRAAAQSQARARIRTAAPQVLPKVHASGARGARVTDELLSSSIAVRAPDGTIEVAHTPEEAAALVRARTQSQTQSHTHIAPTPVTE